MSAEEGNPRGRVRLSNPVARIILGLVGVLFLQAAFLLFWRAMPPAGSPLPAREGYSAEGERRVSMMPDGEVHAVGETVTFTFGFTCHDTSRGDRVFASFLVRGDTPIAASAYGLGAVSLYAPPRVTLTLTDALDTGMIVRGWTIARLSPGDSVVLAVELLIGGEAVGDWRLLYGMERDPTDPPEADRIVRRRLNVRNKAASPVVTVTPRQSQGRSHPKR